SSRVSRCRRCSASICWALTELGSSMTTSAGTSRRSFADGAPLWPRRFACGRRGPDGPSSTMEGPVGLPCGNPTMMPGTTPPQPGPRCAPPGYPPPPLDGPSGTVGGLLMPMFGEGPRPDIFCANTLSDATTSSAAMQSRAVRCTRMGLPPVVYRSLGRGDETDGLVFLQLLHDAGELGLRNSGDGDADLVEAAGHRA